MSDFKLSNDIKVEYDKENYLFRFIGINADKMKKVTSRAFSCLLGQNQWESIGKVILERFNAVVKEQIDPYYMVRGDLAELVVKDFMKDTYKEKGIDVELVTWKKEEVRYDNFQKNDKYGGLIDIAIAKPKEYRAVIEVKSKSMKDLEKIKESRGNIDEVLQGKFLSILADVPKCLMVYVFLTPHQEQEIKDYILSQQTIGYSVDSMMFAKEILKNFKWTHKDFEIRVFKYAIDEEEKKEMETNMKVAYNNLKHFKDNQVIAETYFAPQETAYLKGLANYEPTLDDLENDLPF